MKMMDYMQTGVVELAAAMKVVIVIFSLFALILLRLISGRSALKVE